MIRFSFFYSLVIQECADMVTMDLTLFLQIVNVIILMFLLNAVLYKPVLKVLKERRAKVNGLKEEIITFDQKAKERQDEVDAKMREASKKAKDALDTARAEAKAAGDAEMDTIKSATDADKEKQMDEIRQQVDTATKELKANLDGFAQDMAGKILGRSL